MLRHVSVFDCAHKAGIILGMNLGSERRRYIVTSAIIGWTHAQYDPW